MTDHDVRATVAEAYTEALRRSHEHGGGCCGPAEAPVSVTARLAGYEETAPAGEALVSSFGCGNPLAFSGVRAGETVLDLGAGAGLDLLLAAEKVGPTGRVIGVDMTDAMIEDARKNAAGAGLDNVEVRKGFIEDLPVADESVDLVISNCVINLSPEKQRVFAEIERVLVPGGRFSISDIVVEDLPGWIRENVAAYAACVAGAISEADYGSGLRAAGFEDVEVGEQLVYSAEQIRGLVASDLADLGLDPATLEGAYGQVEGKVWSAKFSGRKPPRG